MPLRPLLTTNVQRPTSPCIHALLIWFVLLAGAIANGAVREAWLVPRLGETWGHIVSTLLLSLLILVIVMAAIEWIAPASRSDAIAIGLMWVGMTVSFEFLAGHFLFGNSWERLLADYDVRHGRIWPIVLVVTFFAPRLAAAARHRFGP